MGLWCEERDFRYPPVSQNAVLRTLHTRWIFQSSLSVTWCYLSFFFQIFTQKYVYSHCSICIKMYVDSKCALKSLNRVLPRYPFRMGRWTLLDPQNFCWLRGPGSLSGRNIFCSVLTQVWFINMRDKTDCSSQLHLWISIVLIIIVISSFLSLSYPKNALDSHTEAHICAWQSLTVIGEYKWFYCGVCSIRLRGNMLLLYSQCSCFLLSPAGV